MQHQIFPAMMRQEFLPSRDMLLQPSGNPALRGPAQAGVVEVAALENLYKVFERC